MGAVRGCLAAVSTDSRLSLTRWRQAVVVARAEPEGAGPETLTDLRDALRVTVSVSGPGGPVRWTLAGGDARDLSTRVAPPRVAEETARRLRAEEEAGPAPVGSFPVVLAPAAAGPLVHEVLGHPLESDAAGSWLAERREGLGGLTLIDEPGRAPGAGNYRIDDEGVPGRRVVLVKEGEVVGRLRDRLSARAAGVEPTGHGRRQSYRDLPAPRLACTVLEPGEAEPEDLIAEVVRGLYVERVAGGTVDPVSGSLCLLAEAARLIEGGRPGAPVRGAVLFGEASDWLSALRGVGSDLRFDHGATDCSKGGQALPVILGAPTLSFSEVPVGGIGS
jgi:TldD protein